MFAQQNDAAAGAVTLTGPIPDDEAIGYQKHMTQHVLPDTPLRWLYQVCNCFLLRELDAAVTSFTIQRPDAAARVLGFEQQAQLFGRVCDRLGEAPPVIDVADVLRDPVGVLGALCARLQIPFRPVMLQWSRGSCESDGVWAPHWYAVVEHSTGFAPFRSRRSDLTDFQRELAEHGRPIYQRLAVHRIAAADTPKPAP